MKLQHGIGGLENLDSLTNWEKRVFVQPWEKIIFAIHTAMMGLSKHLGIDQVPTKFRDEWTWASLRTGAEAMNPFDYFKFRYYEKWLGGISGFFVSQGYISQAELDARTKEFLANPNAAGPSGGNPEIDKQVIHYLEVGDSPKRDVNIQAKFKVGDKVTVKDVPPSDHTRIPGHLRSKTGVVDLVYPDNYTYFCSTGPDGLGEAMPSYCVKFDPNELWKELAESNNLFYADIFETYLEKAA
jgi:nitrile hydratase